MGAGGVVVAGARAQCGARRGRRVPPPPPPSFSLCSSPAFAALGLPPAATAIELGAGVTGLPSLVAAAVGAATGAVREVVATDVAECVPGLAANAASNLPPGAELVVEDGGSEPAPVALSDWGLPASVVAAVAGEADAHARLAPAPPPPPRSVVEDAEAGAGAPKASAAVAAAGGDPAAPHPVRLRVLELDWADAAAATANGRLARRYDLVLVADAVYLASSVPPLVSALRSVSDAASVVLLAYYKRSESAHAAFWPALRRAFGVAQVDAASFGAARADGPGVGLFRLSRVPDAEYGEAGEEEGEGEKGGEKE